jgi:hypothetical protein
MGEGLRVSHGHQKWQNTTGELDNIAIVPASMLPLTKIVKEKVNTLPKGGVFLCYAQENSRQKKILKRVEETFREQGHVVRSLSMREVYKTIPNF